MSKILLKRSAVTATPPSLDVGEMAWSELNGGKLFIGESGSQVSLVADAGSQANTVDSVNGEVGVVVLNTGHISESGNLYYTDTRANAAPDVVSNTTHRGLTNNPHSVTKSQIGLTDVQDIKSNFAGTVAPGVSNDNTQGYSVGSDWVDTVADKSYTASDVSTGAAVWLLTSSLGTTVHSGLTGLGADDHTQYSLADGTRDYTGAVTINTSGIAALNIDSALANQSVLEFRINAVKRGHVSIDSTGTVMYFGSTGTTNNGKIAIDFNNGGRLATTNTLYDTFVTADGHIPNKKYVDDAITAGAGAAQLDELSDVVSATNTNRFALLANGTTGYVGRAIVEADVSDLQSYILASGVTYANLDANGDVGSGASQVAQGSHNHDTVYVALAGSTMTSGADITYVGGGEPLGLPATPSGATAAASKAYVDSEISALQSGIDPKDSCLVATTANVTLSGLQTVDGVSLAAGDRVLVKDQSTGSENGLYTAETTAWVRTTDADTDSEVTQGLYTLIVSGTTQSGNGYFLSTPDPITVGTTALTFVLYTSTPDPLTAGNGIDITTSTITTRVDGTSIVFNAGVQEVGTVDGGSF